MKPIPREFIKDCIKHELQQVKQWKEEYNWAIHVAEHFIRLATLVELLEKHDCGSIGGFDIGQANKIRTLEDRAKWVLNKEKDNK